MFALRQPVARSSWCLCSNPPHQEQGAAHILHHLLIQVPANHSKEGNQIPPSCSLHRAVLLCAFTHAAACSRASGHGTIKQQVYQQQLPAAEARNTRQQVAAAMPLTSQGWNRPAQQCQWPRRGPAQRRQSHLHGRGRALGPAQWLCFSHFSHQHYLQRLPTQAGCLLFSARWAAHRWARRRRPVRLWQ